MRKFLVLVCAVALAASAAAQRKTAAPAATATAAAKICADPYDVREAADGWPEGPVYILFHHDKSKALWVRNPAIKAPGIEAASLASAHTLACVEETRLEMGRYESGELGYTPAWNVILVRVSDRRVYFMRTGFDGESPPEVKYHRGAGTGKPPIAPFVRWLRLIVDQKVARLKVRPRPKSHDKASALAFSPDGTKVVMAQEPYNYGNGMQPVPVTIFDLTGAQPPKVVAVDHPVRQAAIPNSGNMVAVERYGSRVELWDVATAKVVHKLETPSGASLFFGPDNMLAAAGEGKASIWDPVSEHELHSAKGFLVALSPGSVWLTATKNSGGIVVQELESGSTVATFPAIGGQDRCLISHDGKAMARISSFGGSMYVAGNPESQLLDLPAASMGMESLSGASAVAPTHDGFVFGNREGFIGIVSRSGKATRMFATDHSAIQTIAVSRDEKLIAVADSSGNISIWELL